MINWGGWREVDGEDLTRRAAPLDFSMSRCGLARTELFAAPELHFSQSLDFVHSGLLVSRSATLLTLNG